MNTRPHPSSRSTTSPTHKEPSDLPAALMPKVQAESPERVKNSLDFTLQADFIPLVALLKVAGLADSGGQAKWMVSEGSVYVDHVIELRKSCKIRGGQKVQTGATEINVHAMSRGVL